MNAGVDEPVAGWVFYDYDLRGLQESAAFGSIAGPGIATSFDNARQLTSSSDTTGGAIRTLTYLYDPASNRIPITHPDNPAVNYFTYEYDALNRVTAIRESGAIPLVTIAYDDSGDRQSIARANGATTAYAYDAMSRLQSLAHDLAGTAQDLTLTIPSVGGYNPASQIVARTRSNDLYAYLPAAAATQVYVPDGLNQYASVGGAGFTYDASGNLISDGGSTFTYDVENRLLTASGARTATLSYDPGGRLYKTQGAIAATATRLLYDGDKLIAEYDSTGALLRRYVHGAGQDEPFVWYEGSSLAAAARRFLHVDHQGTVVAVSDQGGGAIALGRFDPWGTAAAGNVGRFGYTGQIVVPELAAGGNPATAMLYYKARIYWPALGRFLQVDPVGYDDQFNLYAYVGNDPVNNADPTGQCVPTKMTRIFCRGLHERPEQEANLISPSNTPITEDRAADLERQVGFTERGEGEYGAMMGIPITKIDDVRSARENAYADQAAEFPHARGIDDQADAFRHADVSIRLERAVGGDQARQVMDAHERSGPGNPRGARLMDLVNNYNARIISRVFPNVNPRVLARMMLNAGLLKTQPFRIVP